MISRFFTMGKIPELRLEPQGSDEEHPVPELEILLRIDQYWELSQLMTDLKYTSEAGHSTKKTWRKIKKIVANSIVTERDRLWFNKLQNGG